MAIQLECINFIVPIETIKQKYPGGWQQCLTDHKNLIGGRVWYDDYLFRDGAMNPRDIQRLVDEWQELGFKTHEGGENPSKWAEVCVVESFLGGATLPCEWIEVEDEIAFIKEKPKGATFGRTDFC